MQAAADAKYYGHDEVYNLLKFRGAKTPVGYESEIFFFETEKLPSIPGCMLLKTMVTVHRKLEKLR